VSELCLRYLEWAIVYYRKNGELTSEIHNIKRVIDTLQQLYGHTAARDYDPLALETTRDRWVGAGLTRSGCNRFTGIVKRVFRWGTQRGLIPPMVYSGLTAVEGLRKDRTNAPDNEPVGPVSDDVLKKTLEKLSPMLRTMVSCKQPPR
jgi:hypothetical protein